MRLNIDTDSLAPTEIVEECARIILRRVFVRIKNSESCESAHWQKQKSVALLLKICSRSNGSVKWYDQKNRWHTLGWVRKKIYVCSLFFKLKKMSWDLHFSQQSCRANLQSCKVQSNVCSFHSLNECTKCGKTCNNFLFSLVCNYILAHANAVSSM